MKEISFRTNIFIGENSLDRLMKITSEKVFIVTDPFIEQSGMMKEVTNRLENKDNDYFIFSDIVPDPPIETVAAGVKAIQEFGPGIMIAIGGGSAIDAAKAMKDFSIKLSPHQQAIKFIAIPTTSGTGTEVTSFSVITDEVNQVKHPLVADSLLPDEAILDTTLVKSVPASVTADTGMDVLTHAIEAYVSTNANDFSDAFAEKAVQLIFDYLPRCYKDGNDLEAREKVHHASCLAGMAFNMVGLGVNHSIAHVCGAQFHIPHGRMNALLLTTVIEYNAEIQGFSAGGQSFAAKKYAQLAKIVGFPATNSRIGVNSLIKHINQLKKELHLPVNLRACGITKEKLLASIGKISEAALIDGCTPTNPRKPTTKDIESIVEKIL
ncbi:Aldehyde-alcohol dehydrogenase [Neobacillus rhizosphaerae]|uniref:Aldehyde-alcohol dehydrogenase n=1 Tax=Neobacillus rhizosphaerae TaxID=2880965 RepID=A0ABN8KMG7_9BACI|nr:1-propanol dehydrogenase PduQ [Neobacillus rhizosphaerae]CAH2714721.1 Aldehyde-alcohol dehydrogenase [Neobacillus rhizosphaerae]